MPTAITSFSRNTVRNISRDIEAAIAAVAAQYNITLEGAGASFSPAECTFKIKSGLVSAAAGVETRSVKAYRIHADMHELPPLHSTFTSGNKTFKIVGWNSRARKYPVSAIHIDTGDSYKFSVFMIKNAQNIVQPVAPVSREESAYQDTNADDPDA